jgi:predicted DNA-binding transcriptional regulator AlpA
MSAVVEVLACPSIAAGRIKLASAVYSAEDIAGLLQISERQVWRLRDAGLLPGCMRVGRLVRWRRVVIDEWIAKGCPKPKAR